MQEAKFHPRQGTPLESRDEPDEEPRRTDESGTGKERREFCPMCISVNCF